MTRFDEQAFVMRIRDRLDAAFGDLDSATLARLEAARKLALAQAGMAANEELARQNTLTPEVESRLDAIRQRALARLQTREMARARRWSWNTLAELLNDRPWVTGAVTAAFVAVTTTSLLVLDAPSDSPSLEAELALVASAEDIELYENLDFYLWLAENGLSN